MEIKNSDPKSHFINFLTKKFFLWFEDFLIRRSYFTWTSRLLDRIHVLREETPCIGRAEIKKAHHLGMTVVAFLAREAELKKQLQK